jgi:3-phenylpropionate/trans-cinnamate dioxygenase ferredoxin component
VSWERAVPSDEVGRVLRRAEVAGQPVLVARASDGVAIAVGPICPHQGRPMDGGNVYGDEIDCPHHHYTYDARTGENRYPKRVFPRALADQVKPIRTFPVCEEGGWIWVQIDPP